MTLQKWVLDASQCNSIRELGEFCDVAYVDYSKPWPHGHRPHKMLISQAVADEILGYIENRYQSKVMARQQLRFRLIPCEVKE